VSAYLVPLEAEETQRAGAALKALDNWINTHKLQLVEDRYKEALDSIHAALTTTNRYIKHRENSGERNADREDQLSGLWFNASSAIAPFDRDLAQICSVKGYGWADEKNWDKAVFSKIPSSLDDVVRGLVSLHEKGAARPLPTWVPVAGVVFAVLTFFSLFYIVVGGTSVGKSQRVPFDIWVAFCIAASFSFLGGTAVTTGHLPLPGSRFFGGTPGQFAVRGGIAVLIIAFGILWAAYH
jgi:hypothetical protein